MVGLSQARGYWKDARLRSANYLLLPQALDFIVGPARRPEDGIGPFAHRRGALAQVQGRIAECRKEIQASYPAKFCVLDFLKDSIVLGLRMIKELLERVD